MKRKTAKEILSESFIELAQTKNIDKITVKDITENCGYIYKFANPLNNKSTASISRNGAFFMIIR